MRSLEHLRGIADNLLGELAELERQINNEGGFLTSDPRVARMRSLREEYDAIEDELFEAQMSEDTLDISFG